MSKTIDDEPSIVGVVPIVAVLALAGFCLYDNSYQNKIEKELESYKNPVIQYVDKNHNGLDFKESYEIKKLMGVQDFPKTYVPTIWDWKRAYNKINSNK